MNLTFLAFSAILGFAFILLIAANTKLRFFLFYILLFLSLARLPLGSSSESSLSFRLPLVIILFAGSYKILPITIHSMWNKGLLFWSTFWFVLVSISWYFSSDSIVFVYETVGNFVFFLLTASFFYRSTSKQTVILLALVAISQLPGVFMGVSILRPFFLAMGFDWGTVFHQRSAQAGVYLLPLLLLWFDQTPVKKRITRLSIVALILSLFVIVVTTGARTPSLVFGLVLIFWLRRSVRYLIALSLITILGLYISTTIATEETIDRYSRAYGAVSSGNLEEEANVEFRFEHLMIGIEAFAESPVFGFGHRSWQGLIAEKKGILGYNMAPHNEVVRLIVEYGLFGVLVFSMFIYSCTRKSPGNARGSVIPSSRYSIAVIVVSMIMLNFFHNALFTRHFFFLLGAGAGLHINRLDKKQAQSMKSLNAV